MNRIPNYQYRKRIIKNARKNIKKIQDEYVDEWLINLDNKKYYLSQEEISIIIQTLNDARDVLKEMERDLE